MKSLKLSKKKKDFFTFSKQNRKFLKWKRKFPLNFQNEIFKKRVSNEFLLVSKKFRFRNVSKRETDLHPGQTN